MKEIVAAALGGFRYGIKIRLPHALIMTLLFRRDQAVSQQIRTILILTRDHAINLAKLCSNLQGQAKVSSPPYSRSSKNSHRRTTFPADYPLSVESFFQINTIIRQYQKEGNL
jgi:hypothetical protein